MQQEGNSGKGKFSRQAVCGKYAWIHINFNCWEKGSGWKFCYHLNWSNWTFKIDNMIPIDFDFKSVSSPTYFYHL